LRGQIDVWFEQDGRRVLVDYKTDRVSAEEARERLRSYRLQLQLYALALEQANGKRPMQAVAYFLRPNVALDVDLSPQDLEQAREAVRRFFAAQAKVEFPLRIGDHCLRCPHYRGLCPAKLSSLDRKEETTSAGEEGISSSPLPQASEPAKRSRPRKAPPNAGQLSLPFQLKGSFEDGSS
jgi:hypothetical protein